MGIEAIEHNARCATLLEPTPHAILACLKSRLLRSIF